MITVKPFFVCLLQKCSFSFSSVTTCYVVSLNYVIVHFFVLVRQNKQREDVTLSVGKLRACTILTKIQHNNQYIPTNQPLHAVVIMYCSAVILDYIVFLLLCPSTCFSCFKVLLRVLFFFSYPLDALIHLVNYPQIS